MELRPYQEKAVNDLRESIRRGNRRIILQAATGSGKTICAAAIAKGTVEKGNNLLFLVNKRDLVYQAVNRFTDFGLGEHVGVIMSGEESCLLKQIQIGTIQTYHRRSRTDDPCWVPWFHDAQTIIVDEAHSSLSRTYMDVLNKYENRVIIGLTATPARSDERPLGQIYQDMVSISSVRELTEQGYLVPAEYYAPEKYDLDKIKIVRGDYDQKQLGEKVDRPKLVGNLYEQWARLAGGRQTIGFAVNVKHSKHIRDEFSRRGVNIAHIDAHTPPDEREYIYRSFETGDIQYITNCRVATEGCDLPIASCIQIAAPSKFITRYIQMGGRGLRPHPGKTDCIIIDHTGCVQSHGFLDDDIEWTLEGKEKAYRKPKKRSKERHILTCKVCSCAFMGPRCPQCGTPIENYGRKIEALDAELVRLDTPKKEKFSREDKNRFWAMLEYERRRLQKTEKWKLAQYKSRTGVWPRNLEDIGPMKPDMETVNWLKYQRIKWAKSQQKRAAQ